MTNKEQSVVAMFDSTGKLVAIVHGERTPLMYTVKQFSKRDYEMFFADFNKPIKNEDIKTKDTSKDLEQKG